MFEEYYPHSCNDIRPLETITLYNQLIVFSSIQRNINTTGCVFKESYMYRIIVLNMQTSKWANSDFFLSEYLSLLNHMRM